MAISNPFSKPSNLAAALSAKGAELRNREAAQANAADEFIASAAVARTESATAAKHADAVERALDILDEAGVSL